MLMTRSIPNVILSALYKCRLISSFLIMEEKIDKLFNLFNDLKNKQLFSLSIQ